MKLVIKTNFPLILGNKISEMVKKNAKFLGNLDNFDIYI